MDKPISINDKKPESGKRYNVFSPAALHWTYAYWRSDPNGGHFETEIGLYVYASHWMLEPEWPKEFQ